MSGAQTGPAPAGAVAEAAVGPGLLDQVVAATKQTERDRAQELIRALTEEALRGTVTLTRPFRPRWNGRSRKSTAACPTSSTL